MICMNCSNGAEYVIMGTSFGLCSICADAFGLGVARAEDGEETVLVPVSDMDEYLEGDCDD